MNLSPRETREIQRIHEDMTHASEDGHTCLGCGYDIAVCACIDMIEYIENYGKEI